MATAGNITAVLTLNATGFDSGLNSSLQAVERFKSAFTKSITPLSKDLDKLKFSLDMLDTSLEVASTLINEFSVNAKNLRQFSTYATSVNKLANALKLLSSDTVTAEYGMNVINNMFKYFQNTLNGTEVKVKGVVSSIERLTVAEEREAQVTEQVAVATKQYDSALTVALPKMRDMIINATGVASAMEKEAVATEKDAMAKEKASASTNKLTNANKTLSSSLSMLRNAFTLVGSMIAYNFIHNLATATNETINAKSEMNGYFQMLGYGKTQVADFNKELDKTVKKFPRLNKYALGETISSIGVEFELTTAEMKKAMPVVSMITSEYLRAGRNVNEASLAVKDILQGEFQRLSRETGVKSEQLKEAGWSGDKKDVMGLLEALDKVGKSRNWDVFVTKANSLNDAVLILQNRFSEWSADMVEKVQPSILRVFNDLMIIASEFSRVITPMIDWLGGDGIGQSIVKWGGLATAISLVATSLIHLRTGANLTQIAQMGLTKSIGATILGLEAETVAEHGLINSFILSHTEIDKDTLKRHGRLTSITATITGLEAETVAERGRLASLSASILGLDMAIFKEYGFSVALAQSTTQMEAQKLASMGLVKRIALISATMLPAIGVVGAFALAFGTLAVQMNESAKEMEKFNKLVNEGDSIINDAKDTVQYYTDKQESLKKKLSETTKGTLEYRMVQDELRSVNQDLITSNENLESSIKAVEVARSSQAHYEERLTELGVEHQKRLADAYQQAGYTASESYEMANSSLADANKGAEQLRITLQKIAKLEYKGEQNINDLLDYYDKTGVDKEKGKVYLTEAERLNARARAGLEKGMTDESFMGRLDGWLNYYETQVELWINNIKAKVLGGDWGEIFESIWKGIAHAFADLPIVKDFWGWIFEQTGINDYKGTGWSGLSELLFDGIKNGIETMMPNLRGFDLLGMIFDALLPQGAFASDGGSDHPSFMEDVSAILGFDVQSWIDSFNADPLGTLGIGLPNIDIIGLIKSLIPMDTGGFDLGQWLKDIFNIDGIIEYFTTNLPTIVFSVSSTASTVGSLFSGLKSTIQGHLTNIVTNVSTGFENAKNYAVTKITAMRDSTSNVIHQMTDAWVKMKDSILNSAKLIYDGVKEKFDGVKNTLKDFFSKLQNPSQWGAGDKSMSRTPKPATARRLFRPSSNGGKRGAGINPYTSPNQKVKLEDLIDMVGGDNKVTLSDFLSMFTDGGFGGWNFHQASKKRIFDVGKTWKTAPPSIKGIGSVGSGYQVGRFWDGKPSFTFDEFLSVAEAIFSAIPYMFYYNSEWKGNWASALMSGATNCSDGSDALLALASLFGFSGQKVHTTLSNGTGHFYTVINGKTMDTTNFQNHRSWSALGGAGASPRRSGGAEIGSKTVNIEININEPVYGVDDLDRHIQDSVQKGLQREFNDPLSGVM